MLSEETIANLVDCQLPDDKIRQLLVELSSDRLDLRILTAFIKSIKAKCAFKFDGTLNAMDCSGTGGSGLPHFNTSTTVAFVLAAGGVKVAKFGNRAASSLSGSFDLLEGLGIPASIPYEHVHELLQNVGLVSFTHHITIRPWQNYPRFVAVYLVQAFSIQSVRCFIHSIPACV